VPPSLPMSTLQLVRLTDRNDPVIDELVAKKSLRSPEMANAMRQNSALVHLGN